MEGYTLIEMLAGLAILGFAVGGLAAGTGVLGRAQSSLLSVQSLDQSVRTAQTLIERELALHGPVSSTAPGSFSGDGQQFTFDCGATNPCQVSLAQNAQGLTVSVGRPDGETTAAALGAVGPASFVYSGSQGQAATWPPVGQPGQWLKSILLVRNSGDQRPLLVAQTWLEQPLQCDFDVVNQACR